MPATKSLRSGTWASTLLPSSRSARMPLLDQLARRLAAEELDQRRDPLRLGDPGHVGRRLDAQHGDAPLDEILQQIAVVAGDLDHPALLRPGRAIDHRRHVAPRRARASESE